MDLSTLYFALLVPSLLLSAFFSSSEAAFLSLRKVRIRRLVEDAVPGAERVARMVDEPAKVLPTILLGNNLVNTAFAALATVIMVALIGEGRGVLAATAASTIVLLVLGETLPKTVAIRHSERLFFLYARPLQLVELLLLPFAAALQLVNRFLAALLGSDARALFTEEEIKTAISIGMEEGSVDEEEGEMLENVFRFGDRQVREVMTPRTEIVQLESGTTLREFLSIYRDHYHTRFPVFEDDMENVVGILSVKDVVSALGARGRIRRHARHHAAAPRRVRAGHQAGGPAIPRDARRGQPDGDRRGRVRRHCWSGHHQAAHRGDRRARWRGGQAA